MSLQTRKKTDTTQKWESRELGASAEHAVPSTPEDERALDDALGSVPISIRMSKSLLEELKALAKENGLGYQPYMRMILTQHVNSMKR
jgi:hypothetical protein